MRLAVIAACAACGAAHPAPGGASAPVPFEDDFGLIFVTVEVNGTPRAFLLDSGADQTLLDRDVARELGLALHDDASSAQPGGDITLAHATDVAMRIGNVPFTVHDVWVTPLAPLQRFVGRRIDGLIGDEFLEGHVTEVDYARRELRFGTPAAGEAVPVELRDREAFVQVTIDGVPARLKIDTGSMDPVGLTAQFVSEQHLFAGAPKLARPGVGLGGATAGFQTRLASLVLATHHLGPMIAGYTDDGTHRDYAGTVGAPVLRQFRVTFDYPRRRLLLAPAPAQPFGEDQSGISAATFADDLHRCEVLAVAPGSPAAETGIAVGDEIVAVDGAPFTRLAALWSRLRVAGPLQLTVRRAGTARTVSLTLRPLL